MKFRSVNRWFSTTTAVQHSCYPKQQHSFKHNRFREDGHQLQYRRTTQCLIPRTLNQNRIQQFHSKESRVNRTFPSNKTFNSSSWRNAGGFASLILLLSLFGISSSIVNAEEEEEDSNHKQDKGSIEGERKWGINAARMFVYMATVDSLSVQRRAAQGLAYLASKDEAAANKLVREGAIDALCSLLKIDDDNVRINTFRAIASLSSKEVAKMTILHSESIMKEFNAYVSNTSPRDPEILSLIATSLKHLSAEEVGSSLVFAQGGFECAMKLANSFEVKVKKGALATLVNLSKNDQLRETMVKSSILSVLNSCGLTSLSVVHPLVAECASELSKNKNARHAIVQSGLLQHLKGWVHSNDRNLRFYTASTIENLIHSDETAVVVIRELGIDSLVSLADIKDIDIQHIVGRIFNNLKKGTQEARGQHAREHVVIGDDFKLH